MVLGRLVPSYERKSIEIKGNTEILARRNHDHGQSTGSS